MIQISKKLTGRKYWRSLDQLHESGEFQSWLDTEFPSLADEPLDSTSRRNMLKLMGASFGLAGLTACRRPVQHLLPHSRGFEDYIPSKPLLYRTAMTLGGMAIGVTVKTVDGRPVKVEGTPGHPFSLGKTKSFHQASVLSLYDPDRKQGISTGGRQATWDEFTAFAGQHMGTLGGGAGLRFLSDFVASPSLSAVRRHALGKFPQAKWVEYEPVLTNETASNVFPLHDFSKAEVVVALDSDFLGLDSTSPLSTKQFANKRSQVEDGASMNRLYVVESQMSLTGGVADHRFRLKSSEVGAFASSLLAAVQQASSPLKIVGQASGGDRILAAMAKDLLANRGKSVVLAGPRQPAGVHAVVQQINQALGNAGSTVRYIKGPSEQTRPQLELLKQLAGEMASGQVNTLVITAWNPAFTVPAELEFAANLKKVANVIYLAQEADETAQLSKWVIPAAHYMESWGDVLAPDGTATIQQPVIDALWGGRTPAELLAVLSGYKDQKPYDIIKNHWTGVLKGGDKAWRSALHEGLASAPGAAANTAPAGAFSNAPGASISAGSGFEVVFIPGFSTWDGRFGNNGWMQELPDPMTTLVWDNAALVSVADAKRLSLERGDVITIERGGRKVDMPVIVQPGQCEGSVTVAVGYGRTRCGRSWYGCRGEHLCHSHLGRLRFRKRLQRNKDGTQIPAVPNARSPHHGGADHRKRPPDRA